MCVHTWLHTIYGLKGMVIFCASIYAFSENHKSFVFLCFLAASGLWISCMFFCFVGEKIWVMSGLWVYYSAISDLPQYKGCFKVFSVRDCYLRSDCGWDCGKLKCHHPFCLQAYNCFVLNTRNNYSTRDQEERFILRLFLHGAQCILKT